MSKFCCDVHAMAPEEGHHEGCPENTCICGKKHRDHPGMWCSEKAVLKSDVRKLSERAYHRIKTLETALLTIIEGTPTARTPNGYQCQNCGVVDGHNKVCHAGIAIAVMEKGKRL